MSQRPSIHDTAIIQSVAAVIARQLGESYGAHDQVAADIADVLGENPHDDGYQLARRLEKHHDWECTFNTAEELDCASGELRSQVRSATATWVERNSIKPKKAVGDAVEVTQKGVAYSGEIVKIDEAHAEYTVTIPALGHVKEGPGTHGWIIKYEELHELAASPEDFFLSIQNGMAGA